MPVPVLVQCLRATSLRFLSLARSLSLSFVLVLPFSHSHFPTVWQVHGTPRTSSYVHKIVLVVQSYKRRYYSESYVWAHMYIYVLYSMWLRVAIPKNRYVHMYMYVGSPTLKIYIHMYVSTYIRTYVHMQPRDEQRIMRN